MQRRPVCALARVTRLSCFVALLIVAACRQRHLLGATDTNLLTLGRAAPRCHPARPRPGRRPPRRLGIGSYSGFALLAELTFLTKTGILSQWKRNLLTTRPETVPIPRTIRMTMITSITTTTMTMTMTARNARNHTHRLSLTDGPRECEQARIASTAPNARKNI